MSSTFYNTSIIKNRFVGEIVCKNARFESLQNQICDNGGKWRSHRGSKSLFVDYIIEMEKGGI